MEAAIEAHAPSPWVCAIAVHLALKLFDAADNHTDITRTLTQAQLARLLRVSVDSVQDATTVLRAAGVCTTTHIYARRRRIGMRYTMHRHALSKTAGSTRQDLQDLRTKSTKSSSAPSAPPVSTPAAPEVCPIAEAPWLFDAPVMAEKSEAARCECHAPAPELLELQAEPADVPQTDLPLETDPAPIPRPSDAQLRLTFYATLDAQPLLSDADLLATVGPIIARRNPGARVPADHLARQLRIVRQRHDPKYREKQHRRTRCQDTRPRIHTKASDLAVCQAWDRRFAEDAPPVPLRDVIREQLRAEIGAAVEALPPETAAVLRQAVRPDLDDMRRRCPRLTDMDRHVRDLVVVRVLDALRGRSVPATIAALVDEARAGQAPARTTIGGAADLSPSEGWARLRAELSARRA